MMYAYVHFIDDKSKHIVDIENIKKHNAATYVKNKNYKVMWDEDEAYYEGYVLDTADTEEALSLQISGKRYSVPTEKQSLSASELSDGHPDGNFKELEAPTVSNISELGKQKVAKVKLMQMEDLVQKLPRSASVQGVYGTCSQKSITGKPLQSTSILNTSNESEPPKKEPKRNSSISNNPIIIDDDADAEMPGAKDEDYLSKLKELKSRMKILKKEKNDLIHEVKEMDAIILNLRSKNAEFANTNRKLSDIVISRFDKMEGTIRAALNSNSEVATRNGIHPAIGFFDDQQQKYHMGKGVYIHKDLYNRFVGYLKPPILVKDLATFLFGEATLKVSTVTAKTLDRIKSKGPPPKALNPLKLTIIRDFLTYCLEDKKFAALSSDQKQHHINSIGSYISLLIAVLKKPKQNEKTSEVTDEGPLPMIGESTADSEVEAPTVITLSTEDIEKFNSNQNRYVSEDHTQDEN